ncbi:MAG: hypothetical protein ACYDHN_15700, partial [Solirubrobacteraceae bacterium]
VEAEAEGTRVGPEWEDGVLGALYDAAFSKPGAEIIGVLVGQPTQTNVPPRIAAMIPAGTARPPSRAQLDHPAWAYIHSTMARYYSGFDIVGWWVSRPGPSTTLDRIDLESASEWFARPTQFGFVFDSQHRRAALYGWHSGRYTQIHEGPVPHRLTRPGERLPSVSRAAATAFGVGAALGLAGWIAAGQPSLTLGPKNVVDRQHSS